MRYGAVLRTLGKVNEGGKVIDEAVGVLGKLREQGDTSEATAIGLSLGFTTQARLASSVDAEGQALPISERSIEAIRPLATAPDATVAARRAYGEALNMNGFLKRSNQQFEQAIIALDEARRVQRSIDNLQMTDLTSAAAYAESTAWLVQAYGEMDRGEELKRAAQEAVAVSSQVLEKRPGHMQALRAQALATSPLANYLLDDMNAAEALKAAGRHHAGVARVRAARPRQCRLMEQSRRLLPDPERQPAGAWAGRPMRPPPSGPRSTSSGAGPRV